jgi:DNA polymerase-3 subunit beta
VKFFCDRIALLAAIVTASRATAAKSPVPALEGLLLEAGDGNVRLTGYDLKTGIVALVEAEVEEPGGIVLNARLLAEIVRHAPEDRISFASGAGHQMRIDCGANVFEIIGSPDEDYPELPSIDGQNSVEIEARTLRAMITQTSFVIAVNDLSRPAHTGALFEVERHRVTVVTLDRYRLAIRREELTAGDAEPCAFIVPGGALEEVEKIIQGDEDPVKITVGAKHIMFTIGATVLISRRLEGEFFNYRSSIPKSAKYTIRADRRELVDAIERVSLIINDKVKSPVRCIFADGALRLLSQSPFGRASDEVGVDGDGEGIEIGFNNKYLLDALRAAPADEVAVQLTTAGSPSFLLPADGGEQFLYMILPVRLSRAEE